MISQDAWWRLDKAGRVQAGKLVRRHNYCPGDDCKAYSRKWWWARWQVVSLIDIVKLNFQVLVTSECWEHRMGKARGTPGLCFRRRHKDKPDSKTESPEWSRLIWQVLSCPSGDDFIARGQSLTPSPSLTVAGCLGVAAVKWVNITMLSAFAHN